MRFTQIDPHDIDLTDERFRISFILSSDELAVSIRDLGLLNPPVLAQRKGGRTILVSGWKRVLACRALSLSPIPVFVADEKDDLELFKGAVYENASVRTLSAVEKAEVRAIRAALTATGGRRADAAELLGVSRKTSLERVRRSDSSKRGGSGIQAIRSPRWPGS